MPSSTATTVTLPKYFPFTGSLFWKSGKPLSSRSWRLPDAISSATEHTNQPIESSAVTTSRSKSSILMTFALESLFTSPCRSLRSSTVVLFHRGSASLTTSEM